MLSDESSDIMEGFLCPICKRDEKNIDQLLQHFESAHSEEQDLVQTFRSVFSKAKRKILKLDETELSRTFENTLMTGKYLLGSNPFPEYEFENVYQEIGPVVDHFEYFKAVRNPRLERYATETNKLIIRLNKLLTNRPTEPQQIKQHEQKVR